MEKDNKKKENDNEAFAAFVISCDENTLDLYYERQRYEVERTKELAKKKKGDWVWFQLEKNSKEVVKDYGDMARRWNSRLSPNGEILLDLNAVARNYREYPEMRTALEPLPNKPWSMEVDWLEDPDERLHRKRGIRLGKMHEVTVKVVVDETKERGEDDVSFHIIEVHYESPDEIQLEMAYSPWVEQLLMNMKPIEDGNIVPVRAREPGKMHSKNRDYGIIVRSRDGVLYVWSNDSGLLFVARHRPNQYDHLDTGDFVQFKRAVRKQYNDITAKDLEKANRSASRTKVVDRRRDLNEALVETRFKVPKKEDLIPKQRYFDHCDSFLGNMRVGLAKIERLLGDKGVSMEKVYGQRVRAWAGPANMQTADARAEDARFWTIEEMFDYPLEFDDDDDFEDKEASDSDTDDERRRGAPEDDEQDE